jgi:hypothetical protein
MNLKLIGGALINLDNVLHVHFERDEGRNSLRATIRFVDGSEDALYHLAASALLDWVDSANGSEVEIILSPAELPSTRPAP